MIQKSRLTGAIARGVKALQVAQDDDGGFVSYTGRGVTGFNEPVGQVTTFATALVLSATTGLRGIDRLQSMQERAAEFLLGEMSATGTFNYWPRHSDKARERPYPDDLDVTACCLVALQEYRPELVRAEMLAAVVRQLTLCEIRVGGPYYTWIVPKEGADEWHDVDLGVNSNVAYLLHRQGVELPHLVDLVEEAIEVGAYKTPYYAASAYPVIYFISRFYRGAKVERLREYVLEHRDEWGWWGNPLDSALAVTALLNMGSLVAEVEPAVRRLLASQEAGMWPAQALFLEQQGAGEEYYAGAPALTTAFVLEALGKYMMATSREEKSGESARLLRSTVDEDIYESAVQRVRIRFEQLDANLRDQALVALERQLKRDKDHEVVLLPQFWVASLKPVVGGSAMREELIMFGMASLYGWISYTIYDDFLDGVGVPELLPVANVAMRELALLFAMAVPGDAGAALAEGVMDRIDAANTWEVVHCRARIERSEFSLEAVPDYGGFEWLAARSLGHALGPLGLLLLRGHALDGVVMRQSLRFFTHYLIARQLNDDVHDWEEDLVRGQVNAVGALLLRRHLADSGGTQRQLLQPLVAKLRKQLWEEDIVTVCDYIFRHTEAARVALAENPEIADASRLAALLEPLERSAHEALAERSQTQAFIEAYRRGGRG